MRRHKKERHFLLHTLEHLVGVFVLLFIAISLSVVSRAVGDARSENLAAIFLALPPVSFSAEKISETCVDNATKANYKFSIAPEEGGYITLNTPNGSDTIKSTNGLGFERILGVGSYTWSGVPFSEYSGSGSGGFVITDVCAQISAVVVAPPPPPPPTTAEVNFSVNTSSEVACNSGEPLTKVSFNAGVSTAGDFTLSENSNIVSTLTPGDHQIANGSYTWKVNVKEGYVTTSQTTGSFLLNASCPKPSSSINESLLPTTKKILDVGLFVENKSVAVGSRTFDSEDIEFRVTTNPSVSVSIMSIDGLGITQKLGNAKKDELLSISGQDVWVYIIDAAKMPSGTLRLFARVQDSSSIASDSAELSLSISHNSIVSSPTIQKEQIIPNNGARASEQEKTAILERISDPSSCGNAEECRIYCNSVNSDTTNCESFAQKMIMIFRESSPSLADGISSERIEQILTDIKKRPKELPDAVIDAETFAQYCADLTHAEMCTKILIRHDLSTDDALIEKKSEIESERVEERQLFALRVGARAFVDSDNDGVSDFDEVNIYQTEPSKSDTDGDGFHDGAELLAQTNPRGGSLESTTTTEKVYLDESVEFESPVLTGQVNALLLTVKSVEVVEIAQEKNGTTTAKKLKFEGHAPPNSFVTLFIFSDPIVVTVKADATGSWVYTFDKELPDGSHQVYSAITNSDGHILAKSTPLPFIKTAAAVSLGAALIPEDAKSGFFNGTSLYGLFALIIGVLGLALSVIGFVVRYEGKEQSIKE